jgi:hypothetical protein
MRQNISKYNLKSKGFLASLKHVTLGAELPVQTQNVLLQPGLQPRTCPTVLYEWVWKNSTTCNDFENADNYN